MKKKILVGLVVVFVVVVFFIAYIAWSSRNTAKAEANKILHSFAQDTSSRWYCENGSGKGIDNSTPWWEQIFLSDVDSEKIAKSIEQYLSSRGYAITNAFVEKADENVDDGTLMRQGIDTYNRNYSYWKIEGENADFTVIARVSEDLTLNNCFESSHKDISINPENFTTKIVIMFQDKN